MYIELITRPEIFEELREAWQALSACARLSSIFMTWEWQALWWKHYGLDDCLRLFVARLGDDVVGLLPMYVQPRVVGGIWPLRRLRQVGTGGDTTPDDLDPLIAPGHEDAASRALARAVMEASDGWDVLEIGDCQPGSPFIEQMRDAARSRSGTVKDVVSATIPCGPIGDDYEAFVGSLSSNRRSIVRRARRRFDQLEGSGYRLVTRPADVDAPLDRLVELHRQRWEERSTSQSFASERYIEFHRSVMRALAERDLLRLHCLELDGRTIAVYYCYRYRDTVYYFQSGFEPEQGHLQPGIVLMTHVVEDALAQGCTAVDLLRGNYGHKRHWFRHTRDTHGVLVLRPGWPALGWRMKQWLDRLAERARTSAAPHADGESAAEAGRA